MSRHTEIEPRAEFATMERSRATPLRPAIWMTGLLVWATVIALLFHVPAWAGVFLCSLTGLSFLLYLVSYSYLMLHDREALRRERLRVKGRQVQERGALVTASTDLIGAQVQPVEMETWPLETKQAAVVSRRDA
jgi:hypothetical protein